MTVKKRKYIKAANLLELDDLIFLYCVITILCYWVLVFKGDGCLLIVVFVEI